MPHKKVVWPLIQLFIGGNCFHSYWHGTSYRFCVIALKERLLRATQLLRGRLFCKCCSSERKGILAVESQGIPQSHTAQQTSHTGFMGRDTRGWVPASAWERSSRNWQATGLYSFFGGGRRGVFQDEDSQGGEW